VNNKLSCLDIVELVTDYIDNALPAEERPRFEHHLTYCPGCVSYVDQIRETIRVTRRLPREEPLTQALREALLSQFPGSGPSARARRDRADSRDDDVEASRPPAWGRWHFSRRADDTRDSPSRPKRRRWPDRTGQLLEPRSAHSRSVKPRPAPSPAVSLTNRRAPPSRD
jgi:anti-sigma factor RsiW